MFSRINVFLPDEVVSSQPSAWRSGASLVAWVITFDLSGMGDPASSYATAGTVVRIPPLHQISDTIRGGRGEEEEEEEEDLT